MKTVSRLSIAPVKGMALVHPDEFSLERFGVAANRRFFVVDEDGRRYGQIRNGTLVRIEPDYDETSGALTLRFPDGTVVDGVPQLRRGARHRLLRPTGPRARRRRRVVGGDLRRSSAGRSGSYAATSRAPASTAGIGTVTMLSDASLDALGATG